MRCTSFIGQQVTSTCFTMLKLTRPRHFKSFCDCFVCFLHGISVFLGIKIMNINFVLP